jgi:glucose/arabinose dehydrogenase
MRRLPVLIAGAALVVGVAGCGSSSPTAAPVQPSASGVVAPSHVKVHWHTVVTGLTTPVGIASPDDGSGRVFVDDEPGQIRLVKAGHLQATPYLDISSKVTSGGEQGMLSIAFHPGFAKHPKVYASYTRSDGDLVVASFTASSARANHVAPSTERRIILIPHHGATNHNGGQLFFGNDGDLYVTTGDGGGEGDQFKRADTRNNLTGKILRINVDKSCGTKHYCIPPTNPYAHSKTYRHEIIAWGLRNPWRVSIDRPTNTLWIADVGQDKYEEIDHVGVPAVHDFGWSCKEADSTYNAAECGSRKITYPVHVIPHSPGGNCAVIGGYVYRGKTYAAVAGGLYLYTDNCSGRVWGLRKINGKWANAQIGSLSGGPTAMGVDQAGNEYAVTLGGDLYRASFTKS